jgi:hypothetical protein
MHTGPSEYTLDGAIGPRVSSCVSDGPMTTMWTVGPPTTRTPSMTHIPRRAPGSLVPLPGSRYGISFSRV